MSERSLSDQALDHAIGAVTEFYNGVIAEKDAEIANLRAELERVTGLYHKARGIPEVASR